VVELVDSTQNRVKEPDFPFFVPLVARAQTAGRGRLGRRWYSPPGKGLYLSVKFPKGFFPEGDLGCLSLVVGLSVSRTVDAYALSGIKWPNDVYLRGKKVAGILTEVSGPSVVVGIGVNLNEERFPPELAPLATSIYRETQQRVDPDEFLELLLENLSEDLRRFREEGFKPFVEPINRKLVWKGRRVLVDNERGRLLGVNSKGWIVLRTCYGKVKEFPAGEVSLRADRI